MSLKQLGTIGTNGTEYAVHHLQDTSDRRRLWLASGRRVVILNSGELVQRANDRNTAGSRIIEIGIDC